MPLYIYIVSACSHPFAMQHAIHKLRPIGLRVPRYVPAVLEAGAVLRGDMERPPFMLKLSVRSASSERKSAEVQINKTEMGLIGGFAN